MNRSIIAVLLIALLSAGSVFAQDNALGLYFSDTEFTSDTASATVVPGFLLAGYIALTNPTGSLIRGYEVGITSTAADFGIPMTSLTFDTNEGTNVNQIITLMTPKPALAGGTVLATVFLFTESSDLETISFGASSPSSLPDGLPTVDYGGSNILACGQPFGTPVVAWLNGQAVSSEGSTWDSVKAVFR